MVFIVSTLIASNLEFILGGLDYKIKNGSIDSSIDLGVLLRAVKATDFLHFEVSSSMHWMLVPTLPFSVAAGWNCYGTDPLSRKEKGENKHFTSFKGQILYLLYWASLL